MKQLRNYIVTVEWNGRHNDEVNAFSVDAYSVFEAKKKALAFFADKGAYEPYVVDIEVRGFVLYKNHRSYIIGSPYGVSVYNKENEKIEHLAKLEALYIKLKKLNAAFWNNNITPYLAANRGKIFVVNDGGSIIEVDENSYSVGGNINYHPDQYADKEVVHDDTILKLSQQQATKRYRVGKVRCYLENCFFNYLEKYARHLCVIENVKKRVVNVVVNNRNYIFSYDFVHGYTRVEIVYWPEEEPITLVYGRE